MTNQLTQDSPDQGKLFRKAAVTIIEATDKLQTTWDQISRSKKQSRLNVQDVLGVDLQDGMDLTLDRDTDSIPRSFGLDYEDNTITETAKVVATLVEDSRTCIVEAERKSEDSWCIATGKHLSSKVPTYRLKSVKDGTDEIYNHKTGVDQLVADRCLDIFSKIESLLKNEIESREDSIREMAPWIVRLFRGLVRSKA